jgi:CubicO group peptidase (beta-lactamase class C family)
LAIPKPPGTVTSYSNEGSSLAALVVEHVTNISFDRYLKEKVFKPLNVDTTKIGYRLTDFSDIEELAKQYAFVINETQLKEWQSFLPQLNLTTIEVYPRISRV